MNIIKTILIYAYSFILTALPAVTYTEGVVGQPTSFLPGLEQTQHDKTLSKMLYRGLFKYDIYGTLVPDLADTWSIEDDGFVYTIKLKPNQKWSNGEPITSDDLIYTAFNNQNLAGVATDKVDNLTVRYTLPNKYSPFLSLLTTGVLPNNSLNNKNLLTIPTSGQFKLIWVEKNGPLIKRINLQSTDRSTPIQKVVFKYYANQEELETGARLGEINGFLSSREVKLDNFTDYSFPIQAIHYSLFFNMTDEAVQDLDLRRDLRAVLDTDALIQTFGISVQGAISRSVFTDTAINYDTYDAKLVKDYSEKEIVLTVPNVPKHVQLAEAIKDVWEDKLNVNVTIRRIDPAEMEERVIKPRNFEVLLYGQEVGRDPDRYVSLHSTQATYPGNNLSQFTNVRADRALEEGRAVLEDSDRQVHYNELQKSVDETVPIIYLYHPFARYYVSDHVKGIGQKYTFTEGDRFLDFANWTFSR